MSNISRFKQRIFEIPIIGYCARLASSFVKLPIILKNLDNTQATLRSSMQESSDKLAANLATVTETTEKFNGKLKALRLGQDNLQQVVGGLKKQPSATTSEKHDDLFANDHSLDVFYTNFEDKFRGSEELITKRLEEYMPLFTKKRSLFKGSPALDIGCGRGEMLGLLKKNKINALGLDINFDMVSRANKKGLEAVQGDAVSYLKDCKSQSLGAITGFHIVEHIPFPVLMNIFSEAHRTLVEDGFVIFETPNPENLEVGASTFYTDPSHLHPLPPNLLGFALETCGFRKVEILRLHPSEVDKQALAGLPDDVIKLLYGPRDYAAIGYK